MTIRAVTLWGPWASLIAYSWKTIETRRHARLAGLVGQRFAIHQGKRFVPLDVMLELLRTAQRPRAAEWLVEYYDELPRGAVVATAVGAAHRLLGSEIDDMAACCPARGAHGLVVRGVRRLKAPAPARGAQGIWHWKPEEGVLCA